MNQETDTRPLMVSIQCFTYNHEPYIRQCLEGFVMQKTNFRFEAIVHDDASTDGTADIIREYAEKYPDIIKPILETENQFSKHDGSLDRIMDEACTGRYIAICEGDDYWTNPQKLQIQVDFMENHPDYSMCWHDAPSISAKDGMEKDNHRRYLADTTCRTRDIIEGGGEFTPTCSLLYRKGLKQRAPKELFAQYVGDYPLVLYLSIIGKVFYFDIRMGVYRVDVPNSWSQRMIVNASTGDDNKRWFYEKKIYDDFNRFSFFMYDHSFKQCEYKYLFYYFWQKKEYIKAGRYWHKIDYKKRPWAIRWILYMHGYGKLKNLIKAVGGITSKQHISFL